MKKIKFIIVSYFIVIILLFLYSYTQVDLDLTFSRVPLFHSIIKSFQYIGYFQRQVSTILYVALVVLLFGFYSLFLRLAYKKTLTRKQIWLIIFGTAGILLFSYNAFSYDLFNYIFDARILTHYHQNPYLHKALDFPHDPMLTFMRWTHRTYPYGPIWLGITIPLSFLGMQLFIPTFILFKALMAGSYIGTCWIIEKLYARLVLKRTLYGLVLFALNPLILIECLVSAHIDIVMIFLALLSLQMLMNKQYIRTFILLILSVGIKFGTLLLLPVYIVVFFLKDLKSRFRVIIWICLLAMIGVVVLEANRTNFQPWYLIVAIPFAALLSDMFLVVIATTILSFFALMQYTPYLYKGDWNPPVPMILNTIYIIGIMLVFFVSLFYQLYFTRRPKKT